MPIDMISVDAPYVARVDVIPPAKAYHTDGRPARRTIHFFRIAVIREVTLRRARPCDASVFAVRPVVVPIDAHVDV